MPQTTVRGPGARWRIAALVAIGLWVLFGLGVILEHSLSRLLCSRVVLREIPSDGDLVAVIFTRDCGATTLGSTSVAVWNRLAGDEAKSSDVLFRLKGVRSDLDVRWSQAPEAGGAPSLTIAYPEDASVSLKAVVWNGLQVSYAAR